MSKRTLSVSFLTAGLTAGILATAVGPAAAQGNPVGGAGNVYFLSGAVNASGVAQETFSFGDRGDEVYFGDWYGEGEDLPMVRRGNVFFVPNQTNPNITQSVFAYGDAGDTVLIGDWDGDGVDSIAVRRQNHYFVKNDNKKTGVADWDFHYGDAGDKVLVGNWDGKVTAPRGGVDNNSDGDFTDKGTPAYAADIPNRLPVAGVDNTVPADADYTDVAAVPAVAGQPIDDVPPVAGDPGFDKDGDGSYTDEGDRQPGTGVDNNGDGDFDDAAAAAATGDVAPIPAKGDTLMVQRGGEFFVKNSLVSGTADYTFFFGDPGDTILVGDWAKAATAETKTATAKSAVGGNGADQLAVRRENTYFLSTELEAARAGKTNPKTDRSFAFGDAGDIVLVASLSSDRVDALGKADASAVTFAKGDLMWTATPGIAEPRLATSADTTTQKVLDDGTLATAAGAPVMYAATDPMYYAGTGIAGTVNSAIPVPKVATSAGDLLQNKYNEDGSLASAKVAGDGFGVRR